MVRRKIVDYREFDFKEFNTGMIEKLKNLEKEFDIEMEVDGDRKKVKILMVEV
ncbi:MAG: hypothetical protein QXL51_01100 [Candidatus Aenigmatarchaeota archaeon]